MKDLNVGKCECREDRAVKHFITWALIEPPERTHISPSVTLVLIVGDAGKIPPDYLRLYAPAHFRETRS